MWENEVRLSLRGRAKGGILLTRVLKVAGIGESAVDERCGDLLKPSNPSVGVYAKSDGVHLRIAAKAADEEAALALVEPVERALRDIFADNLWGADSETLEAHVGQLLMAKGMTLATMESCTGGLLASTVTDVPGSSNYFKGGLVTYTDEMKIAFGVDAGLVLEHGAVSSHVAVAMARAARLQLGADVGVGITGVAGPTEQGGRPVGTVFIAVDHAEGSHSSASRFQAPRFNVKTRAATAALFQVRRLLMELGGR